MSEEAKRTFSREYKVAAVRRMLAGENVSALARELGVRRKYLYQWRERFRLGGAIALRSRGRPTKAEVLSMQAPGGDEPAAGEVGGADLAGRKNGVRVDFSVAPRRAASAGGPSGRARRGGRARRRSAA